MIQFDLNKRIAGVTRLISVAAILAMLLVPAPAQASIDGVTGPFTLTARTGYVTVGDGASVYSWGYTTGTQLQLPGPTFIVTEDTVVEVTLNNALPAAAGNTSIVFPGHKLTSTSGGVAGLLTQEAPPGGSVTYTFTASEPGTYIYHSGTRPDLQVEMGLYGAIIVRPSGPWPKHAYPHAATKFDREYLFLLSEIDLDIHRAAELQAGAPGPMAVNTEPYSPEYWLINGRTAPDTMVEANSGLLPNQPYTSLAVMHPGEKVLLRVVGAGHQIHPFHHHGNHTRVLARDGRLLLSATDATKLAGPNLFTIPSLPGGTVDAIFEWTGKDVGFDVYGHTAGDLSTCIDSTNNTTGLPGADGFADASPATNKNWEWCADHRKPIPVTFPDLSDMTFGGFWSGSPFLGTLGSLPPGEGGLNPNGGYTMMWHSHTERELVNNDVFPGGMMTMLIIEDPTVVLPIE